MADAYGLVDWEYRNGWGSGNALVRLADGSEVCRDGGEPEDATFLRDYAPVVDELNALHRDAEALMRALVSIAVLNAGLSEAPRMAREAVEEWRRSRSRSSGVGGERP